MSTKYFLLTKSEEKSITNNESNQIIYPNRSLTYILPEVNLKYYCMNGLFESKLIEWAKQFCDKSKSFIDIGAHTGTYSVSLSNYAKHVYSFEPQKMTYYGLCGSIALSNIQNVTCINVGLGSKEQSGTAVLRIKSDDGGGSSIHENPDAKILKTEKIYIKTLDSYHIDNIGFIKMDVEENELYVLKGAVETIKRSDYPPILFESNENNEELFDYIKSIGYKIIKIRGYTNMYLTEKQMEEVEPEPEEESEDDPLCPPVPIQED